MTVKKKQKYPRILILDIENSPNLAYIWQCKTEYVPESMIEFPWYTLCWCAKWYGEKKVMSSALIDFPKEYKKDPENDRMIFDPLWKLLDEADIVVGHNIDRFDCRKINARFIMHDMLPPSPYKTVDTLKIARRFFMFTSNKLDDLAKYFKIGQKVDTGGFKLWRQCMQGNKTAFRKMVRYCKHDVELSEKIYKKLLPYISNHPNVGNYVDDAEKHCPKCGSEKLEKRGFIHTNVARYQRYHCQDCGAWSRGRTNERENKTKVTN